MVAPPPSAPSPGPSSTGRARGSFKITADPVVPGSPAAPRPTAIPPAPARAPAPAPAPAPARAPAPAPAPRARDLADLGLVGLEGLVLIGRGASSSVYRARQPALDRVVAVKVLDVALGDAESQRAFKDECSATGRLSEHPNIVNVHGSGVLKDRHPYILMEHYSGGSLAARIASGSTMGLDDVLRIGVKMCGAIDAAHRAGVLHRDVKPGNILMSRYGEPVLGDFGIASLRAGPESKPAFTPNYAAPEVLRGEPASSSSDLYALCGTLFALLTGRPPYGRIGSEGYDVFASRILAGPRPVLSHPEVDPPVAAIIMGGLAPDPTRRPTSAGALGLLLQTQQDRLGFPATDMAGVPRPARPRPVTSGPLIAAPPVGPPSPRPPTEPPVEVAEPVGAVAMSRRAQTAVIDIAIVLCVTALTVAASLALPGVPAPTPISSMVGFVVSLSLYHLLFGGLVGQTPGRRWAGLTLVDEAGDPPGLLRVIGRVFIGFGAAVPLGAGYLAGLGQRARTWPDDVTATSAAVTSTPAAAAQFWVTCAVAAACAASVTIASLNLLGTA